MPGEGRGKYDRGTALTKRQAEAYRMCEVEGLSRSEVGERMGIGAPGVTKHLQDARRKIAAGGSPDVVNETSVDMNTPIMSGAALAVADMIEEEMVRYRATAAPSTTPIEGLMKEKLHMSLVAMTIDKAVRASLGQLGKFAADMLGGIRLEQGRPTSIVRIEDARKMDEIVEMFREEMVRRGMMVDVTPEKPEDDEQAA